MSSSSRTSGPPPLPPTRQGSRTLTPDNLPRPAQSPPEKQVADCIGIAFSTDQQRQENSAPAQATPEVTQPFVVQAGSWQTNSVPESVAGYEILGVLGHGGMGIVYEARQPQLGRTVALKMILSGNRPHEADHFRFEREAQTIARLHHPNIVQIYEVGEHEGKPFFSMEYCPGGRLDRKLAGKPLEPVQAAALVEQLARAIHVVHQKGVLHRDLKPANVLFGEDGTPKITDFGLAKKLGEVARTVTGEVLGTPSYMAPEQAGGKNREVGPACDIYALGAILYQCLTGRPPFKGPTVAYTLFQVMTEKPTPPRQVNPNVPADLEAICLKCLHKEPEYRYDTAMSLAEDLNRFRAYRAIESPPEGGLTGLGAWLRNNKSATASLAIAVLMLLVGIVMASWEAPTTHDPRQAQTSEAVQKPSSPAKETRPNDSVEQVNVPSPEHVSQNRQEKPVGDVEVSPPHSGEEAGEKRNPRREEAANVEVPKESRVVEETDGNKGSQAEGNPSDTRLSPRQEQPGQQWAGYARKATLAGHTSGVLCVAFRPDGKRIASGGCDKTIKVWDAQTGEEVLSIQDTGEVMSVWFSPDGQHILAGSTESTLKVWDAQTGRPILSLAGHRGIVTSACYSPDGRRIVSGSSDNLVKVWDALTGRHLLSLEGHTRQVTRVAFSPDGKRILSGSYDKTVKVWDSETCTEILSLDGHSSWVTDVSFSPDGKYILSASSDKTLKVWDAQTGADIHTLKGHTRMVSSGSFSPDGKYVLSASHDTTLMVWDVTTGQNLAKLTGHDNEVNAVRFSPDGKRILSASWDKTLGIWVASTE